MPVSNINVDAQLHPNPINNLAATNSTNPNVAVTPAGQVNNVVPQAIPQNNQVQQQVPNQPVNPGQPQVNPQLINPVANTQQPMPISEILASAISRDASDVHLTFGYRPKLRINGDLEEISAPVLTEDNLYSYAKELSTKRADIDVDAIYQADLGYEIHNRRFRVNIFRQSAKYSIVARLVPNEIKTPEELGLPQVIKSFVNYPYGLVLVTGPTGSGKSTTLASVLGIINQTQKRHVITLEDPIEFVYPKSVAQIEQREKGNDFVEWPRALASILRQDPDVVLVGEMRDFETIAAAITIAETGHLVFATLHTNSAAQSIDRMIDVFPEAQQAQIRTQLSNVISAVVSQRLLKLSSGKGRVAAHEIMLATSAIRSNIREGKVYQIDSAIQTGGNLGMISMELSLANLVKQGKISREVAMESTTKPKELEFMLNK